MRTIFVEGDELDVRPHTADPAALGIGIIGCGNIVENAHIPAYRTCGMRVVAIASRTHEHALAVASRCGIDHVYRDADELIGDPHVDIVDIALPPDLQPSIVARAVAAGKHVLAHKPLAVNFNEAKEAVSAASREGVLLAVNQNGRFDPSINASRTLIQRGILGDRIVASMHMHLTMPWQEYYRHPRYDRLMLLHMSVHHIDQFRWLFGTPTRISARIRRIPGDGYHGENLAAYTLEYEDGFMATSVDSGADWSSELGIHYRILGTKAVLIGEIGWPKNNGSSLRYELRENPGVWHCLRFSRRWFPDAFAATMAELMSSIEEHRSPSNSGADNLDTMRAVFAAYHSAESGRTVELATVDAS